MPVLWIGASRLSKMNVDDPREDTGRGGGSALFQIRGSGPSPARKPRGVKAAVHPPSFPRIPPPPPTHITSPSSGSATVLVRAFPPPLPFTFRLPSSHSLSICESLCPLLFISEALARAPCAVGASQQMGGRSARSQTDSPRGAHFLFAC